MGIIGIVANPNSGKDIRRLVTHATMIDNVEKANILCRIVMGVGGISNDEMYIMPDRNKLGVRVKDTLQGTKEITQFKILDMPIMDMQDDTTRFTQKMVEEMNADVIIVMGGDGTSRAVAKAVGDVPLIAVSTGTNNVYPTLVEGTSVAFAAVAIASGLVSREEAGVRGKRIDIDIANGRRKDIALIDAVFSTSNFVGARAILRNEEMDGVLVTQCHPANIGFSSLAGTIQTIRPDEDIGMYLGLDWQKHDYICAISAGVLLPFGYHDRRTLNLGESITRIMEYDGTVAVDGERELPFRQGDEVSFTLTRNGPRKVDVRKITELAAERGLFKINK